MVDDSNCAINVTLYGKQVRLLLKNSLKLKKGRKLINIIQNDNKYDEFFFGKRIR